MASRKPALKVIRAAAAIDELAEIWRWNAQQYGVPHADDYLQFLHQQITKLAVTYSTGRRIAARPDLRYILIRRRAGGHGHVAVYTFDKLHVNVLHVFHTRQNWQTKLISE